MSHFWNVCVYFSSDVLPVTQFLSLVDCMIWLRCVLAITLVTPCILVSQCCKSLSVLKHLVCVSTTLPV